MIIIADHHKTKVTSFQSYWEVSDYIEQLESGKQETSPLMPDWSFTIHPYQRAFNFYKYMEEAIKTGLTEKIRGLSVLEVCQGDIGKVSVLPVKPDLKIEGIRQGWCEAYLRTHGYFSLAVDDLLPFMKPW
jgi:hypothetical protein